MRFLVKPIYGNGWTDGIGSVDQPGPFEVEGDMLEVGQANGIVRGDPDLEGASFEASSASVEPGDVFRCEVHGPGLNLYGYCYIDPLK
jgi:hypothetical protein